MEKEEFVKVVDTVTLSLYQNKEQEALEKIQPILEQYQKMLQDLAATGITEDTMQFFSWMKRLIENVQNQDMLGMADCLQENGRKWIDMYYGQRRE